MTAHLGISLRQEWVEPLLEARTSLPALEVIFEQWVFAPEPALRKLERLRERYPFVLHCLSMNLGSCDPLDRDYCERVRAFAERFEVAGVSDHLSWRSTGDQWTLSLLPLPRTEEAVRHVATRVDAVQSFLGRTIALENVSQYLPTPGEITPAEMFNALHRACGMKIHLDLNNLVVNERWLGESPESFLYSLEAEVAWVHVAGHQDVPKPVDDHSAMPSARCMRLLEGLKTDAPVILEWDRERPDYAALVAKLQTEEAGHAPSIA